MEKYHVYKIIHEMVNSPPLSIAILNYRGVFCGEGSSAVCCVCLHYCGTPESLNMCDMLSECCCTQECPSFLEGKD